MSGYSQVYEGDWNRFVRKGERVQCCDCGLVHVLNFRLKGRSILMQAFRDNRATAQTLKRKAWKRK